MAYEWGHRARAYGVPVDGTPAVGAIAWWDANANGAGSAGHVAYVEQVGAGYVVVSEDNGGGDFRWKWLTPGGYYPTGFIHFRDLSTGGGTSLPNGAYIVAGDTGRVYVMAGGSPMYVSAWGAVGGPHPISGTFTQAQIDAMARYPADGRRSGTTARAGSTSWRAVSGSRSRA